MVNIVLSNLLGIQILLVSTIIPGHFEIEAVINNGQNLYETNAQIVVRGDIEEGITNLGFQQESEFVESTVFKEGCSNKQLQRKPEPRVSIINSQSDPNTFINIVSTSYNDEHPIVENEDENEFLLKFFCSGITLKWLVILILSVMGIVLLIICLFVSINVQFILVFLAFLLLLLIITILIDPLSFFNMIKIS